MLILKAHPNELLEIEHIAQKLMPNLPKQIKFKADEDQNRIAGNIHRAHIAQCRTPLHF